MHGKSFLKPGTELKCSYGKIFQPGYRGPGWKNRDLGPEPARSLIRTLGTFYKGFRGKARSRKPGLSDPGVL